jgi:hypothetical protein
MHLLCIYVKLLLDHGSALNIRAAPIRSGEQFFSFVAADEEISRSAAIGSSELLGFIVKLQFNETQASETKCTEVCWSNYPAKRRVQYSAACFGVHTRDFWGKYFTLLIFLKSES